MQTGTYNCRVPFPRRRPYYWAVTLGVILINVVQYRHVHGFRRQRTATPHNTQRTLTPYHFDNVRIAQIGIRHCYDVGTIQIRTGEQFTIPGRVDNTLYVPVEIPCNRGGV